jgi:hypothetical protein
MHDACLHLGLPEAGIDRLGEAVQPVHHGDQDVAHAAGRRSFITRSQNFAPSVCSIDSPSASLLPLGQRQAPDTPPCCASGLRRARSPATHHVERDQLMVEVREAAAVFGDALPLEAHLPPRGTTISSLPLHDWVRSEGRSNLTLCGKRHAIHAAWISTRSNTSGRTGSTTNWQTSVPRTSLKPVPLHAPNAGAHNVTRPSSQLSGSKLNCQSDVS